MVAEGGIEEQAAIAEKLLSARLGLTPAGPASRGVFFWILLGMIPTRLGPLLGFALLRLGVRGHCQALAECHSGLPLQWH